MPSPPADAAQDRDSALPPRDECATGKSRRIIRALSWANAVAVVGFLLGVAALNRYVDPYNAFSDDATFVKEPIVAKEQQVLWTLAAFRNHPNDHVLIGDSRMAQIDVALVKQRTGVEYANLATGGATLSEMIATYHRAANAHPLREVVLNTCFAHFNRRIDNNRVPEAEQLLDQPWRYVFDPRISLASLSVLRFHFGWGGGATFKPPLDREAFWQFQLQVTAKNQFDRYEFDDERFSRLLALRDDCRRRGTRLTVVVFPEHPDYLRRVDDFGQSATYQRFQQRLVAEFSQAIILTGRPQWADSARYGDPLHFMGSEQGAILDELFPRTPPLP